MCGGGKAPEDKSDKVAAINAQAARDAQVTADAKAAADKAAFEGQLGNSYNTGISSARDFFTQRGLNPDDYMGAITSAANNTRGSVPQGDAAPGTYFSDLGDQVYKAQQAAEQNKALRAINSQFSDDYSTKRVGNELDDSAIAGILGDQKNTATQYVKNLLDRGVITQSGYNGALNNVNGQTAGAQSKLDTIGSGLLEGERTKLNNIINGGRSKASTLDLGDVFDPYSYQGTVDTDFTGWLGKLGDSLKAAAPTDLFSTSGLAGVAGASQGAQNTAFNPAAIAGIFDDTKKDDTTQTTSPF